MRMNGFNRKPALMMANETQTHPRRFETPFIVASARGRRAADPKTLRHKSSAKVRQN